MTRRPADGKLRVLFMQSQEFFGADSRIHATLMQALDRDAFEVHVACTVGDGTDRPASLEAIERIPDVTVRRTRFGPSKSGQSRPRLAWSALIHGPRTVASLVGLARYARRQRIDVIHCTEKPRDALYGYLLARAVGARTVIHIHVKAEGWISSLTQLAMRRADVLLAISDFVARSLVDMGFHRIDTVHNALDADGWDPAEVDGSAVRQEFGVADDAPLLAIVSRLFAWKGHVELVDAMATVCAERPSVRLLIVGEDDPRGTPGRGSLTAELTALVSRLGLTDHVTFTGFRSDVPSIMAASDMFTMPSFEEPFGMVFLEAMALAKPVVALDNGGTPEVVVDGVTGLLSAPGDVDALARNIVALVDDPDRRREMGAAGRERALDVFSPARMARGVEDVYRRACHGVTPAGPGQAGQAGQPAPDD